MKTRVLVNGLLLIHGFVSMALLLAPMPGMTMPRTEAEVQQLLDAIAQELSGKDLVGELIRERRAWATAASRPAKDRT
ncbi:MAG: hypothetical protein TH68_03165 [Candidatus Synechococcus spongiarum 142]|uniref:Uncharacterized protein n=1 Tax=Candidatus Synechococcus spongiarum 142 TaxID=1608213 RepID=A0A6N3XBS5_9SYNE|nr:MAG: hypothetical protein TH68_03165 [Candidatus Synechococcus spongiarum 142]